MKDGLAVQHEYERLGGKHLTDAAMATTVQTLKTMCELLETEERQ